MARISIFTLKWRASRSFLNRKMTNLTCMVEGFSGYRVENRLGGGWGSREAGKETSQKSQWGVRPPRAGRRDGGRNDKMLSYSVCILKMELTGFL